MTTSEKDKISTKNRKINSSLFVSTFTICYLFNCFFFIVLFNPHPYYDFFFKFHLFAYVVVNFLSRVIFNFLLFQLH